MNQELKHQSMVSAQQKIARLRQGFLERIPDMLRQAEALLSQLRQTPLEIDRKQLHLLLHSIHGSCASFGFNSIAVLSAEGERLLSTDGIDEVRLNELHRIIQRLYQLSLDALNQELIGGDRGGELTLAASRPDSGFVRRTNQPIYLCDDDIDQVELLATQLRCFGFSCRVFTDTKSFAEAVLELPPSVVIMDVSFPEHAYGGPLVMSDLKKRVGTAFPVLYLSCHSDFHARINAIKAGCDGYYVKPASTTDLVQELHRLTQPSMKKPYTVLIIDDEPAVAEYNAELLRAAGMNVYVLSRPQYLLQVLNANPIDIVLMDYHMPEYSGEELTKLIRQIPQHIGLPIAYLSSETSQSAKFGAMSIGAEDFILKQADPQELINAVSVRAERMRTLRARMAQDSLSGLYNHSTTTHFLKSAIAESNYSRIPFSLVMVDLDRFKTVNDTYGHVAGDQVIVGVSQLFSHRLRSTDIVGRYGGEEFAIIMPNTTQEQAAQVVERLRQGYEKITFSINQVTFHNTFSAGIATWVYGDTTETIRGRADQALYAAKQNGRNCYCIADLEGSL
ncbi:GGDEF domain-containing response regulator [Kluyvera sp. CHPC 1.251]|uniref:GGDEF domain-containing response regulator n=1 Tax=Kluyvera sp. CHPC 1.251 TaxID=2995175 RepID=UPI002FD7EA50